MNVTSDIADFSRRDINLMGRTKPVLLTGTVGPAVIVIHEVYGFTPTLARFCRWVRDAGFRVYAPILFGTPDAGNTETVKPTRILSLCVSREFAMLRSNKSSPVTEWLRALARLAHQECGGNGVGAIGMCLTGGFALSMALDPVVLASVLAQPGLPAMKPAALDISSADLARVQARAANGFKLRGYRFEGDTLCRAARFETLRNTFGAAFTGTEPAALRFHRRFDRRAGRADTRRGGRGNRVFSRRAVGRTRSSVTTGTAQCAALIAPYGLTFKGAQMGWRCCARSSH
jgi:dienelactone hydrolase